MKLSIIIPTYNEEDYLENVLESITRQNYPNLEVIIADANSEDQTREIAKSYDCKVIEGGLPAKGRNNGAKVAKGELLLFLDADSVLTTNYIHSMVKEFEENQLGIAITQIIPLEKSTINKISHEFANFMIKRIESIKPHGAGCYGIITKKELHEKIGGFDEKLDFGEDTDYIERIGKIAPFKVLRKPKLLISTRRLEEEGLKNLSFKYAKSTVYQLAGKKITAKELDYNFGHEKHENKRIVYSLCGEGLGHAIRSAVIIEYLLKQGYDLIVFASDRAYQYLNNKFENIYEIKGFNTVYEENKVRNRKTFVNNMKYVPTDLTNNLNIMYKLSKKFQPDMVISDFEFYANMLAHLIQVPLISIDNMHVITESYYKTPTKYKKDQVLAASVVHSFIQRQAKTIILTYFYPPLKNKDAIYAPPILRDKIFELKPSNNDHIFVYQTSDSNNQLMSVLKTLNQKFIVYGFHKSDVDENITYKSFNEDEFFTDLSTAKAVITNGGFTLITEALYLKKPILSIPVNKQFEQILNAIYIEKLGYGEHHSKVNQKDIIKFIDNIEKYRVNIEKNYSQESNNDTTFKILENVIREV
ncbi:MAG: glycosyltransferase family protein [Methanobacteriaceae archaeon]|nr:glycosyltransferase family protein [Methanobacteriaceae archaeon]